MSTNKFETYNPIINELAAESIRCSPESWISGRLSIDCGGTAINYKLKSDSSEEKASISGPLRQLCEQLYVTMRQNDDTWTEAFLDFLQKDGSWSFNMKFEYDTPSDVAPEAVATPETKKPWWKLW